MDVLGIPTVLVPPNPGNVSAFGLLTVDVKNDYVQTHVALADALDPATVASTYDELTGAGRRGAGQRGLRAGAAPVRPHRRPALLRPGLRGAGRRARRRHRRRRARRGGRPASTPSTARSTATTSPATPPSRSSGSTSASPASARSAGPRSAAIPRRVTRSGRPSERAGRAFRDARRDAGLLRRRGRVRRHAGRRSAPTSRRGRRSSGPVIIEEFGSTVPVHPGFQVRVDEYLNLIVTRSEA